MKMIREKILLFAAFVGLLWPIGLMADNVTDGKQPADYVNPFIGASTNVGIARAAHGLGKCYPGAATPFGMVQVSPNTITGGDNGSGYSYEHETIEGFAFTQMSGVGWYGDLGNFLVMPTTGELRLIAGKEDGSISGWRSRYAKDSETAQAGYYAATLTDYNIRVEASATTHCGILRITYPQHPLSRLQVDLARRVGGTSVEQQVEVVNDSTIRGWMKCTPDGGGWGDGAGKVDYTLYFYAQVNRKISSSGVWKADIPDGINRKRENVTSLPYLETVAQSTVERNVRAAQGRHLGFFTEFPTFEGETVDLKVGISFVDTAGAERNFMAEIADKDFDTVRREAYEAWNRHLSKIRVEGGTDDERKVFYTALYHSLLDPRIHSDADGRYMGADGKIHDSEARFAKRTLFSGWDVFRSEFPMLQIVSPSTVNDEINSLIALAEQSGTGYFPRWELLNAYSGCMIGNPAISVIADAYAKGIRDFDIDKAIGYSVNSSVKRGNNKEIGYTPEPLSVSNTLEYAYADWCVSVLASGADRPGIAEEYSAKSRAWENVLNDSVGWFCPRYADGRWETWTHSSITQEWLGCIESNLLQQGWFVPHDFSGLVKRIGGVAKASSMLEAMFENTPDDLLWNQYYNHANEPVHFVPFLFNKLEKPWLTQKWTRHICKNAYRNAVEGIVGNEDVGQMSAWYILASTGIHPSCPGDTRMEITSPVFDRVEYTLDGKYHSGNRFTIIAHDNSPENVYIDRALLNGDEYDKCFIDFSEIADGSTLELFMSDKPNHEWGKSE